MPKNQKQIWIDTEQWNILRDRQIETGVPIAEQLRRIIKAALDTPKKEE